ncbi:hypothetical protein B0X29_00425 [Helicobacter pylori]|nr:hypothetical protein B0X29_00425 [Helicobacter pylori]PDW57512.1 hypothetical protein BB440_01630 [Helicobacter pylori]
MLKHYNSKIRINQDFLKAYSLFSSFNHPFNTRAVFYNQNKSFLHYIDLKIILLVIFYAELAF